MDETADLFAVFFLWNSLIIVTCFLMFFRYMTGISNQNPLS